MVTQTEAVSSTRMVSFLFCRIAYHRCVTVCSIPILTNHYVVIANAVLSNRFVIYWQLTIVSGASVGTNVV